MKQIKKSNLADLWYPPVKKRQENYAN
jgi:hypothetical protein